jgi:hypothetical protein
MMRFIAISVDARPALYDVLTGGIARISTPDAIISPRHEWGGILNYEQLKLVREADCAFAASFLEAVV